MRAMKMLILFSFGLAVSLSQSCKREKTQGESGQDAEAAFLPIAAGAVAVGVGVNLTIDVAALSSFVYAVDCTRPTRPGEARFFCAGGARLGQQAVDLLVQSVRNAAQILQWSKASVISHLTFLEGLPQNVLHIAVHAGMIAKESARISPQISSSSGRGNLVDGLKKQVRIEDREKKSCFHVAQYQASLIPSHLRGSDAPGTSMLFLAKAPSPESAEAIALLLCEEYSNTYFAVAKGLTKAAGEKFNRCRKPDKISISNTQERYNTEDISCPGAKACSSVTNCADYKL